MKSSLYIHIPFCLRKCDYCDFFSVPVSQCNSSLFIEKLCREIEFREKEYCIDTWETVYIGGGTPSLLSPDDIKKLSTVIHIDSIKTKNHYTEWTIEANPEDIHVHWLDACMGSGINRISLGIQSMNDQLLTGVGRRGSRSSNIKALELVKKNWRGRLSLDLISGLPGQTISMLENDISEIISYNPDHISLYSLTIEEGTPLDRKISNGSLTEIPDEDETTDLWIFGRDMLEKNGYKQYEVSNFARVGFESIHNMTYWNLDSYIGAGPGATGTIITKDTAYRNTNTQNIEKWLLNPENSFTTEHISKNECIQEFLLMGMRLTEGISRKRFKDRFSKDILQLIGKTVTNWGENKLLQINHDSLFLSRDGLLLLNRFLADCMEELCEK